MIKINRNNIESHAGVLKLKSIPPTKWNKKNKWNISHNGNKINVKKLILPALLELTKHHCAFCDYKLEPDNFDVVLEHFYPSSKFPEKGYLWDNLFPVCNTCTRVKDDHFDECLLRPDDESYSFQNFFWITGEGHLLALNSNKRAECTIDMYKLERGGLVSQRKRWIDIFKKIKPCLDESDEHPFRFLLPFIEENDDVIESILASK